jgi:hypothetical protein
MLTLDQQIEFAKADLASLEWRVREWGKRDWGYHATQARQRLHGLLRLKETGHQLELPL